MLKLDEAMLKNIEQYRDAVKRLFDSDSTEMFPNNNEEHTAVIINEIFCHAQQEVKIFCSCLNHDVWDDTKIKESFLEAIKRGVIFKIVTQKEIDKETKLKNTFEEFHVPIKEKVADYLTNNFIVADKKMFRFEENASERHAFACANSPKIAAKLDEAFNMIFS